MRNDDVIIRTQKWNNTQRYLLKKRDERKSLVNEKKKKTGSTLETEKEGKGCMRRRLIEILLNFLQVLYTHLT